MKRHGLVAIFVRASVICLLLFVGIFASAQARQTTKTKKGGKTQTAIERMSRTTNSDRWAAAARHADRRADQRRHHSKGVK